jgi:hypothetical protein
VAATAGNHQSQVRNASARPGVRGNRPQPRPPRPSNTLPAATSSSAVVALTQRSAKAATTQDKTDGMSGFDWVTDKDQAVGTSKGLRAVLNTSINLLTLGPSNRL